jgi:hypothetical protein
LTRTRPIVEDDLVKTATLDELKDNRELLRGSEPIVVKDGRRTLGILHPLPDPDESIPLEKRHQLYLERGRALRARLQARGITEEQIERDIAELFDNRR